MIQEDICKKKKKKISKRRSDNVSSLTRKCHSLKLYSFNQWHFRIKKNLPRIIIFLFRKLVKVFGMLDYTKHSLRNS